MDFAAVSWVLFFSFCHLEVLGIHMSENKRSVELLFGFVSLPSVKTWMEGTYGIPYKIIIFRDY